MRNRTEDQMTLALIRHGETKANREHRYLGRTDEGLSKDGIDRLLEYKRRNDYPAAEFLFSSPMKRCLETAEILYPNLSPRIIPEWVEMDFGRFEYKTYEELKGDAQYQAWLDSQGTLAFPEGEGREQFMLRCEKGFDKMCREIFRAVGKQKQRAPKSTREIRDRRKKIRKQAVAACIVHGGTIMALLSRLHGNDYYDYQVANGRGYLCRMRDMGGREGFMGNVGMQDMGGREGFVGDVGMQDMDSGAGFAEDVRMQDMGGRAMFVEAVRLGGCMLE